MASSKLPHHLRANRKHLGLSQAELAYLLGAESGAKVCRYERFIREPSLQTALACQIIFQRSARELFPGLYEKAEQDVAARAQTLEKRINGRRPTRQSARKQEILTEIAAPAF